MGCVLGTKSVEDSRNHVGVLHCHPNVEETGGSDRDDATVRVRKQVIKRQRNVRIGDFLGWANTFEKLAKIGVEVVRDLMIEVS